MQNKIIYFNKQKLLAETITYIAITICHGKIIDNSASIRLKHFSQKRQAPLVSQSSPTGLLEGQQIAPRRLWDLEVKRSPT